MLKSTVLSAISSAKQAVGDLAIRCTLIKRGPPVHVPGQSTTYPETPYPVKVVITSFKAREVDGDRVRASDKIGIVFAENGQPTPEPNDLIRTPQGDLRIIYNDPVVVGDEVALSQLHLRLT